MRLKAEVPGNGTRPSRLGPEAAPSATQVLRRQAGGTPQLPAVGNEPIASTMCAGRFRKGAPGGRHKHRSRTLTTRSVVVVGAGTVGLVTGLGLARRGFDVTILELQAAPADGPRDIVYHWCVLPLFADVGMLAEMTKVGVVCPETSIIVLATGENLRVDLSTLSDVTEHPFNLHVPQTSMADIATGVLSQVPGSGIAPV